MIPSIWHSLHPFCSHDVTKEAEFGLKVDPLLLKLQKVSAAESRVKDIASLIDVIKLQSHGDSDLTLKNLHLQSLISDNDVRHFGIK